MARLPLFRTQDPPLTHKCDDMNECFMKELFLRCIYLLRVLYIAKAITAVDSLVI